MADFVDIDHAELETVDSFTDPLQAHLARGRLEAEGIAAYVIHENHVWAAWFLSNALGGVKLQVAEQDADRAREILAAHRRGEYEQALELPAGDPAEPACPRCGAQAAEPVFSRPTLLLIVFSLGLVGVIFPPRRSLCRCRNCGRRWRHDGSSGE